VSARRFPVVVPTVPLDAALAGAKVRTEVLLVLAAIASSLLVYWPYRHDLTPVYAFWDGPSYMMIAHDGYAVRPGNPLASDTVNPPFYASHLPGYPLLVRALSFVGYDRALLLAVLLSTAVAALFFHRLASEVWGCERPAFLTVVFLFVPPHWLLYHSVAATEPLFLAAVLASIYYFEKDRIGFASAAAAVACATRFVGLFMIPAYAWILLRRRAPRRHWLWLAVVPIGPVLYSWYFIHHYGTLFSAVDRNLELIATPTPFWNVTRLVNRWAGGDAELYLLVSAVYLVGLLRLRRFQVPFIYCLFQFAFVSLLSGDPLRYYLAVTAFVLVLAFQDVFSRPSFRWVFPLIAMGSVYWSQKMIPFNGCRVYPEVAAFLGIH
jgi:hypothetical protein